MTSKCLVLDTDVIIHLLKKEPGTVAKFLRLSKVHTRFLITPVAVAEVYAGAFTREYPQIEAFFELCEQIPFDTEMGRIAGRYAQHYRKAFSGISLEDYFFVAAAKTYNCPLWTYNRKHYPMDDIQLLGA